MTNENSIISNSRDYLSTQLMELPCSNLIVLMSSSLKKIPFYFDLSDYPYLVSASPSLKLKPIMNPAAVHHWQESPTIN